MNKYKLKSVRKVCFAALSAVLLSCAFFGYSLFGGKNAEAVSGVPSSTTIGAIYDFKNYCYSESNLNNLSKEILNTVRTNQVSTATLNDLITYAKQTAGTKGVAIGGRKIITLDYGRYRFTTAPSSSYKSLPWMPVYLSTSRSGDAILTLYLAATYSSNGTTSEQEVGYFTNDGTYSTNINHPLPPNSYGTSFMRAFLLGNCGHMDEDSGYYTIYSGKGDTSTNVREYPAKVYESTCNKFGDFIKYYEKEEYDELQKLSGDETGILYPDLATPAELVWQSNESAMDYLGDSYGAYCWPNEAYGTPTNSINPDPVQYYKSAFDYGASGKKNYDLWKNDKVWLPSLTEVGTGDIDVDDNDTTNGIWKLTAEKRSNTPDTKSWLRTANVSAAKTGDYSTYTMYGLDDKGGVTNIDVSEIAGVRPAIHLNLSKIEKENKTVPPIVLPNVVYGEYKGVLQNMSLIPDDQKKWYSDSDMTVSFYFDEECKRGTRPLNAGTYYMMVTLRSGSNRKFKGGDPDVPYRSVKFVVRKVPLYVKWTYEDDTQLNSPPIKVEIDGEFFEQDIKTGNVPEIGMLYSEITGAGLQNWPEYPDKVGDYRASAYIIDEEVHNYNYELVGSDEKPLRSHQFHVDDKEIDLPYFLDNGETTLNYNYKGKQYVQIANIFPKYVEIELSAPDSAMEFVKDLGNVNNVQTYEVKSVAAYEFKISLKDPDNTVWADSGSDKSLKVLRLNIEKAKITVSFNGLPSSWGAAAEVAFSLDVIGVYDSEEAEKIKFEVSYWEGYKATPVAYDATLKKYVIKPNSIAMGEYYIYAVLAGDSEYTGDYELANPNGITQKFTVVQTVSTFEASDVQWQYRVNGQESAEIYDYDAHDRQSKALELDYVEGGYYEFYLTKNETVLRSSPFFVKPEYEGDKSVTDAGLHSLTVKILPVDKNVVFTEQSYTIYFKIKQSKFDISNVKWDYTDPFTYSDSEHKVSIDPDTLPQGLSVVYKTGASHGNTRTDAGIYTTVVTFKVSDEFAKNFVTPDADDPDTYVNNGGFSFAQNWEIKKFDLEAVWNTDNPNGNLFFVPYLQAGGNLVNYSYEKFEGGSYVPCTSITSTTSAQKYRVTATLNEEGAKNYNLTGTTSCEFEIAAGQFAVTVYVEINGKKSDDGAKFTYNGSAFEAEPKVLNGSVTISSFTVDYYKSVSGNRGGKLNSAPVNAGAYIAVITTVFSVDGNTFSNETEFNFEIEKADFDVSALAWQYSKNGITLTARYDRDQKKFIDADGKEAIFAPEYDGTEHVIQLVGLDGIAGLTVDQITGNNGIAAGSKKISLRWGNFDEDNYNEPDFPKTFEWSIAKARIDFDSVKWGYIDADGVEHEFGEDGARFILTRDENGKAINAQVALINLPDYVKDLFKYTTTSDTDKDFGTQSGNSFWAAGEYLTQVVVSGRYDDPNGNRQSFTADDLPPNVVRSLDWEIADRELAIPEYDGSWNVFDNKVHNVLQMCGVPEDQLNYFNVEIVFRNNSNVIDNDYAGYKGVPYEVFDAGDYTVRFNKRDGAEGDSWYVWGQITIEVDQGELVVTWNRTGAVPEAVVKGVYASDRLETKYYLVMADGSKGAEVDKAYIRTTDYVDYIAEPAITEAYTNNLKFSMAAGTDGNPEPTQVKFTYIRFEINQNTQFLDKPTVSNTPVEYTGSDVKFNIANWSYLSTYLYIIEGEEALTQREVGVYHVSVAFRAKDPNDKTDTIGNAVWKGSTTDEVDRTSYELTFEITAPTKYPLAYPSFDITEVDYTGAAINFQITNWMLIQEYVEYEVFYNNESLGKNINLSFTESGIYTVVFSIPEDSIGCWKDDPDNPKKDFTVQLRIRGIGGENTIFTPVINVSSKVYTGEELSFTIDYWDVENLKVTDYPAGVTVDGQILKATNIGTYTVTVSIITDGVTFNDGTTTCKLSFTISSNPDIEAPLNKPVFVKTTGVYTGSEIEFRIDGWEGAGYADYLEIYLVTCDKGEVPVTVNGGSVKATAAGTYTVTIRFKEGANAKWADTNGKEEITLTFTITADAPITGDVIPNPSFEKPSLEWTGRDIQFVINNWSELSKYVDYEVFDEAGNPLNPQTLAPKAVGKYTVVLKIKDGVDKTFEDGTKEMRLQFEIKKANLTQKLDEEGKPVIKDNKPVYVNGDGEEVDIGDYFEPVYKDPDTNEIVPPDQLVDGKEYDVSFTVKEDKKEEFNSNVNNYENVTTEMSKTYRITYVQPKTGLPLIWIIVIVIAVIVLIVLIIVIVIVVKRRNSDGYDDGYEEGYDDEDYEEDYDEDYDDEDYDEDYDDEDYDDYDDDDY